jgi:four helix bundle protein
MSKYRSERMNVDKPPFDICERTFQFALRIVHVCELLDQKPGVRWVLSKQLLGAGTSIGANLEEAQGGQSRADFISKYSIARKEARETRYWLRILVGSRLAEHSVVAPLIAESEELCKILTTIIKKCRSRNPPDKS